MLLKKHDGHDFQNMILVLSKNNLVIGKNLPKYLCPFGGTSPLAFSEHLEKKEVCAELFSVMLPNSSRGSDSGNHHSHCRQEL